MANTIQIKRSSTASDTPSASDLSVGELAVNTADAKLFTKHTDGTVKELAGGGGSGISAVVDDTSPQLGGNLDTNNKNILLGDSDSGNSFANRIKLGAGNDLQLFHSGNASFISDTGTGNLFITGSNAITFQSGDYGETYATFNDDGAVSLRHDNSVKFETTSTGATVTGVLVADGLTVDTNTLHVDATNNRVGIGTTSPSAPLHIAGTGIPTLKIEDTDTAGGYAHFEVNGSALFLESYDEDGTEGQFLFKNATTEAMRIKEDGKVGIGTSAPSTELEVVGDLTLTSTDAGATENPTLDLYRDSASPADGDVLGTIKFSGENDAGEKIDYAEMQVEIGDASDGTEDARLAFNTQINGTSTRYITLAGSYVQMAKPVYVTSNSSIIFEGATNDDFETTLTVTDPTADRTITLPDASGTVLTTGNSDTPTTTTSSGDADFVLVDDGGTMKKITPSNLGIGGGGGGITVEEEGSALSTTATTLNFTGNGVTASGTGATKTIAVNGNEVLISSGTVSNVASIDFYSSVITGFEQYRFVLYNVTPQADARELRMRLGTSNTAITSSIYQSSLFQYGISRTGSQRSSTVNNANSAFFYLTAPTNDMGTNTGENCYAEVLLPNPNSTSGYKHVVARVSNYSYYPAIMGQRISAMAMREQSAINFVTFFAESGNIATASFRLYGIS